jgi:hypothetical protein
VDERGYFVTEMVWEEVPDESGSTENEISSLNKIEPSSSFTRSDTSASNKENKANLMPAAGEKEKGLKAQPANKTPATKKNDAKPTTACGGQKSMMSFFTKK